VEQIVRFTLPPRFPSFLAEYSERRNLLEELGLPVGWPLTELG
jgi:hypothetical protein